MIENPVINQSMEESLKEKHMSHECDMIKAGAKQNEMAFQSSLSKAITRSG